MVGRAAASLLLLAVLSCSAPSAPGRSVRIERVIDGDTVVLATGERVRLLGLDAPEVAGVGEVPECYGLEARAFLIGLLEEAGGRVTLQTERILTDRYGRTLAYLWLDDGTFVNEVLLREGYARFYRGDAERWWHRLQEAEEEARTHRRGLWHPAACGGGVTPRSPPRVGPGLSPAVRPSRSYVRWAGSS